MSTRDFVDGISGALIVSGGFPKTSGIDDFGFSRPDNKGERAVL
jgi:hypothetical protein